MKPRGPPNRPPKKTDRRRTPPSCPSNRLLRRVPRPLRRPPRRPGRRRAPLRRPPTRPPNKPSSEPPVRRQRRVYQSRTGRPIHRRRGGNIAFAAEGDPQVARPHPEEAASGGGMSAKALLVGTRSARVILLGILLVQTSSVKARLAKMLPAKTPLPTKGLPTKTPPAATRSPLLLGGSALVMAGIFVARKAFW